MLNFKSLLTTGLLIVALILVTTGCPAPTPGERVKQLGGVVTERGDGVIDLNLSGKTVTDDDISYIRAFCSNDPRWKSIHTLDLSDTGITDKALELLASAGGVSSEQGLQVLNLTNTNVSEQAVQEFQAKLPDCKIVR